KDLSKMPGTASSNFNEGESYQIIKDKSAETITVLDYINGFGTRYQYPDTLGKNGWKILDGTDTIASYTCQKALLKFRGRTYTAWFTTDIPVSDGPWKFSGLPGLILKIEDADKLFSFNLIGLTQPKTPLSIQISRADYLKCTRAEFKNQLKKRATGMQINFSDGNLELAEMSGKYDPLLMELE
ncbi:MAG TPA: GLPGLI family protein, partial [Pedobacter sp.]|nr:GLPGLI family protein [Pedobacter sp.]